MNGKAWLLVGHDFLRLALDWIGGLYIWFEVDFYYFIILTLSTGGLGQCGFLNGQMHSFSDAGYDIYLRFFRTRPRDHFSRPMLESTLSLVSRSACRLRHFKALLHLPSQNLKHDKLA